MQNKTISKPPWLRKKITLSTHKEPAFFILGTICTRHCSFCAVKKGVPLPVDLNEPENIAQSVKELGARHVVITGPTRDDLVDGGAEQFCKTVGAIKSIDSSIVVELSIPDMRENETAIEMIAKSGADIIGHNLETVPRLYGVRQGSEYRSSLNVLRMLRSFNSSIATKSGIMLGFGERDREVLSLMRDLLDVGCSYLSIGQYLPPSDKHAPVVEYVVPERFEYLKEIGMKMGFKHIKSSPSTRSSYMAQEYLS